LRKETKKTIEVYNKNPFQFAEYTEIRLPQYELNKFITLLDGKKVLDAGCGSGRDVRYFLDEKLKAVGIDLSIGLLEEAKMRGKGTYCQMDICKIGFKNESFDGIWSCAALLHIPKNEISKVILEFYRILKKNGALYISVKEGRGEKFDESKSLPGLKRFYAYYEQHEIEQLFEERGFILLSSDNIVTSSGNRMIELFLKKK